MFLLILSLLFTTLGLETDPDPPIKDSWSVKVLVHTGTILAWRIW